MNSDNRATKRPRIVNLTFFFTKYNYKKKHKLNIYKGYFRDKTTLRGACKKFKRFCGRNKH